MTKPTPSEPLPAGYRMTELGPLPEEWRAVRLGEVAHVSSGGSAPQGSAYFGGSHPFVRVQHLDEEGYLVRRSDFITDEAVRKYRLKPFPPGTIVFPKSGASIRLEKRAVLARQSFLVSHLCAVIPSKKIVDRDFLFFALKAVRFAADKSDGYPTLSLQEIRKRALPLPPLPEQRAIAYVLRSVQRAKEATEGVIAAARELKKSLMRHLFTYGPVPVDQTDRVPMQETEIGPLPAHWKVVRLGDVVDLTMGQSPPSSTYNTQGEGLPFLQGKAEFGDIYPQPIKWCSAPIRIARRDSVLISVRAPVGDVNLAQRDYCIGRGLAALSGKDLLENTFLYYFLQNRKTRLEKKGTGSTFKSINKSVLLNLPIPLPPLPEQHEIARILQTVDEKIQAEETRKEALEALFKSLLHDLMTARRRLPGEFISRFEETSS